MSLRLKLLLSILAGVLATFVLGSALITSHATRKVETEMRAALAVGSRIVANTVDDFEQFDDPRRRLSLLVADFDGDRHLKAEVREGDGTVILSSRLAPPEQPAPEWFRRLVSGPADVAEVPLPAALQRIGTLRLEASPLNEVGEAWSDALTTLTIVTILTSFILAAVAALLEHALKPLDRLVQAFTGIGAAPFGAHVAEQGPVEMLRVYHAFNQMVDRLSKSEVTNRRLTEQLLSVQEEERADIARDLHDEIGPFLFAVDVEASAIGRLARDGGAEAIPARVTSIRDAIGHMQRHVRGILARLRPAALLDMGLAHAIDNLVASWRERHPEIAFVTSVDVPPLGERLDSALYRVVQESLSNAVRHGQPARIEVALAERDGTVELSITDDGRGFVGPSSGGYGIPGMRERMAQCGGHLMVEERQDGRGVTVTAYLQLPAQQSGPPEISREETST